MSTYSRYLAALGDPVLAAQLAVRVNTEPGTQPLPFLVSSEKRAQPISVSDIFPPTSRPTNPRQSLIPTPGTSIDLPPHASSNLSVRHRTVDSGQRCPNCERTRSEALADERRLSHSARGTVVDEEGRVETLAICDLCLMPLGYRVESFAADANAPTEPQRGVGRIAE